MRDGAVGVDLTSAVRAVTLVVEDGYDNGNH